MTNGSDRSGMDQEPPAWAALVARCLMTPVQWERSGDGEFPYQALVNGQRWQIRVNDFPAEPLYTLMIDDRAILDVEDWLDVWTKPPS